MSDNQPGGPALSITRNDGRAAGKPAGTLYDSPMPSPSSIPRLESFELDHTRVRAPYVRHAGTARGPFGDTVSKYDLRLVQPNRAELPTGVVHTLEHLLAGFLRAELGTSVIDISPMGCRTGFYLTAFGEAEPERVAEALRTALGRTAAFADEIPGVSELECGNWRDHSPDGARAWAEEILAAGVTVQETVTIPS